MLGKDAALQLAAQLDTAHGILLREISTVSVAGQALHALAKIAAVARELEAVAMLTPKTLSVTDASIAESVGSPPSPSRKRRRRRPQE